MLSSPSYRNQKDLEIPPEVNVRSKYFCFRSTQILSYKYIVFRSSEKGVMVGCGIKILTLVFCLLMVKYISVLHISQSSLSPYITSAYDSDKCMFLTVLATPRTWYHLFNLRIKTVSFSSVEGNIPVIDACFCTSLVLLCNITYSHS